MAKNADVRNSDNSWVIAGSEGLPVETVGPEEGELPQAAAEELVGDTLEVEDEAQDTLPASTHRGKKDEASLLSSAAGQEEAEFKDFEEHLTYSPKGGSDAAAHPDELLDIHEPEEPDSQDARLDSGAEVLGSSLTGRTGALAEEGSGSSSNEDQDVEGLRRRKGRDVPAAPERPVPHRVLEAEGAEGSLGTTTYLLGAMALLALGLLVFSGGIYDLGDSLTESAGAGNAPEGEQPWSPPLPVISIKEQLEQPPPSPSSAGDPQSLQAMSLLLDKLAKENQDIRAMQAVLQAQKDELQALLEKSETEKAEAGSPTPGLAEMAQLRVSLQQEVAAHRATQAELLRLQGQLQQLEQEGVARGGQQEPTMEQSQAPAQASAPHKKRLHQELKRQHGLLASVQQDLVGALQRAQASGQLEQLQAELGSLEQRLVQELQQAESWEQVWGREETAEPLPHRSKKPFKAERKEGLRYKARGEPRPGRPGDKVGRESKEPGSPKHHKPRRDPRRGRDWDSPARRADGRKVPPHVPHAWELPPLSQYQAPKGCSGAAACAQQEGLAPVQKAGFLQLLEGFMVQRGWGPHYGHLAALLDDVFSPDGTFAHDRLRFSNFADDVEDLLEVLAWQEQGDDEAADDFEEFVLQHYGLGPSSAKDGNRSGPKRHEKEGRRHRPPPDHTSSHGQEGSPRAQG